MNDSAVKRFICQSTALCTQLASRILGWVFLGVVGGVLGCFFFNAEMVSILNGLA